MLGNGTHQVLGDTSRPSFDPGSLKGPMVSPLFSLAPKLMMDGGAPMDLNLTNFVDQLIQPLLHMLANDVIVSEQERIKRCSSVDEDYLSEHLWICVICGVTVSAISVIENVFVFLVFATSKQHRNSYNLYLLLLAFFDVFMGITYILLMSVKVLINYTQSPVLASMWGNYLVPMLGISHVAMTTSSFLITFAAIERYAITVSHGCVEALQKNRRMLVITAFLIALITKGGMFFELEIKHDLSCIGHVNEYYSQPTGLVLNQFYSRYIRFYFRTITTIFAPFFILLYLNFRLVVRLRNTHYELYTKNMDNVKQKKARIRAATRTLVILVGTYLLSNLLSVIISILETFSPTLLWAEETVYFYVLSIDFISLLPMIACALRLPIYASCQPLLRKEMYNFLTHLCARKMPIRRHTLIESEPFATTQTLLSAPEVNL